MTRNDDPAQATEALGQALSDAANAVAEAVHQLEILAGPLQDDPRFTSLDQEDLAGHLMKAAAVLRDAHRAYVRT
jgi:hypothetical protein